ncbi:hypothetical protein JH06_1398 [Blastocystis sp. subtype 4]|uniref:hypothetical protein n=1 Tax=Blastocystis sp. subtype 4 TaxID=944170 RepID=UPI000711DC88|nr:hypothetical protein JH06_1398 [Blastocystis sp. subtype 4]KNB46750.1 hypothetical protein JH06_1398 [Blastocystis sp. subtype 4]|eukprot:XP_014530212.1 hypothetical protein JH06_1398 [Blastocystis sp. subtype 4]
METEEEKKCLCSICQQEKAKYKCPKCSSGYCSVQCYKSHKEMCGGESSNGVDLIVKTADENSELDSEEESRDDITGSLIPRENLEQIRESESIRELLNEPYIQKAILSVIESEDKERRLNELKENSEFSILIDELLLCVKVARRREDGSIEYIGI